MDGSGGCNKNSSFAISFDCNGCSNGKDCLFTWKQNTISLSGCTNNDNKLWTASVKPLLDRLYSAAKQTEVPYDWCANSCGLSTGAVVGIVIGVISGLGLLGVGIHFILKRRRVRDGYIKHTSSLIT